MAHSQARGDGRVAETPVFPAPLPFLDALQYPPARRSATPLRADRAIASAYPPDFGIACRTPCGNHSQKLSAEGNTLLPGHNHLRLNANVKTVTNGYVLRPFCSARIPRKKQAGQVVTGRGKRISPGVFGGSLLV